MLQATAKKHTRTRRRQDQTHLRQCNKDSQQSNKHPCNSSTRIHHHQETLFCSIKQTNLVATAQQGHANIKKVFSAASYSRKLPCNSSTETRHHQEWLFCDIKQEQALLQRLHSLTSRFFLFHVFVPFFFVLPPRFCPRGLQQKKKKNHRRSSRSTRSAPC